MPRNVKQNISGQRFGRYVAIRFLPDDKKHASFLCRCDCGVERAVLSQSLRRGASQSCGCAAADAAPTKHGHARVGRRSATYASWASMMTRCEWPESKSKAYAKYGAIGIRVCPRWHDFETFLADMGERPKGTSIDRKNGALGYEPGNCRWATRKQQNLNTTRTIRVLHEGRVTTAFELCERFVLSLKAVRARAVRRGRDYPAALRSFGIECEWAPAERAA